MPFIASLSDLCSNLSLLWYYIQSHDLLAGVEVELKLFLFKTLVPNGPVKEFSIGSDNALLVKKLWRMATEDPLLS